MKHFDEVLILANPIVGNDGAVVQFSDARSLSEQATHAGESAEQLYVIEQSVTESRSSLTIITGNVRDNFGEVA